MTPTVFAVSQSNAGDRLLNLEKAHLWLQKRLTESRLSHSIGAYEKAIELCEKFRFSLEITEKSAIAALLHDAAKQMSAAELLHYCESRHLYLDEMDRLTPQTLHPFVGAELVKETFLLLDEEVLNAIRFHTTGRPGMGLVEKLVFIADKIEGNTRNPLYVQKMTAHLDYQNPATLDITMRYLLDSTIQYLIEKKQLIHPRTLSARNDYIQHTRR